MSTIVEDEGAFPDVLVAPAPAMFCKMQTHIPNTRIQPTPILHSLVSKLRIFNELGIFYENKNDCVCGTPFA
jgi:hypothetical protein